MGDFSERFGVEKMRSGNAAVYMLKDHFERFATAPQKVDICEGIAKSFYQLEQYEDAASWYETAGRLILTEPSGTPTTKALSALDEFEHALDCHKKDGDEDKFTEISEMVKELKRACASA